MSRSVSSRREEDDTQQVLKDYYTMIEKEYESAGHIIFFRRLVITRAANNWRMNHPPKIKRAFVSHSAKPPALSMLYRKPKP